MTATVIIDEAAVAEMINGANGEVMRRLTVWGERVKQAAIGAMNPQVAAFMGPKVLKRMGRDGRSGYIEIGVEDPTTPAHPIVGNPVLAFNWPKAGGMVVFRSVQHPGSDFTSTSGRYPGGYLPTLLAKVVQQTFSSL